MNLSLVRARSVGSEDRIVTEIRRVAQADRTPASAALRITPS
jgi:hypothetical protein